MAVAIAAAIPATALAAPADFVYRQGKQLMLNGQPYRFVGVNAFGMSGCETGTAWSDADLGAFYRSLPARTVTRTWAFKPWGLAALDRIVARAEANGQKLVLTLGDGVSYCNETDGASAGAGSHKTAAWYAGGFRTNYLPWVRTVVTRYRNSPAIAFWEILNEPGGTSDQAMRAFFD